MKVPCSPIDRTLLLSTTQITNNKKSPVTMQSLVEPGPSDHCSQFFHCCVYISVSYLGASEHHAMGKTSFGFEMGS